MSRQAQMPYGRSEDTRQRRRPCNLTPARFPTAAQSPVATLATAKIFLLHSSGRTRQQTPKASCSFAMTRTRLPVLSIIGRFTIFQPTAENSMKTPTGMPQRWDFGGASMISTSLAIAVPARPTDMAHIIIDSVFWHSPSRIFPCRNSQAAAMSNVPR